MHRLLALFVGVALLATAGQVSRLHTHAYVGHDHPEHQHGLAAHDHDHDQAVVHEDEDDEAPHVESCDPGRHEVSLTLGCAPAMQRVSVNAEAAQLPVLDRLVPLRILAMATDARAHGPPLVPPGPPRAPPHICPA